MKIAIFTQNLDVGGVQKSVANLAVFLSKYHEVHIILAEDNKPVKYRLNGRIKIHKIKTKRIDITEKNAGMKIFKYRIKELEKILKKISPRVVISFEDYNNFILMHTKIRAKKIYSVRVSHKMYEKGKVHLLSEEFYKEMRKKYKKNIIAVNDMIKKTLSHAKVKVIYNGIERKKHLPQKYENYILNVGRLHSQKGQEDLIKAYALISNEITEDLIIVGEGVLREKLENLIETLKLRNRVKITGFDNPYKYYKNASLFVFPSYYEGFPNTLLEAIKAGCAVIGYNFEGSEILLDKVEVGDYKKLAKMMKEYLQNRHKLKSNILKHQKMIKNYSLSKTLREYKRFIEKCAVY